MKWLSILILFLASQVMAKNKVHAVKYPILDYDIQVFLPAAQYRFQDSFDQTKDLRFYRNLSLAFQYQNYYFSIERSSRSESSGNGSILVASKITEDNFIFGYDVYSLRLDSIYPEIKFDFIGFGLLGQTQTQVETTFAGLSQIDDSEKNLVIGFGAAAIFKFGYFITILDARFEQSKDFSPNTVPVTTLKVGGHYDF